MLAGRGILRHPPLALFLAFVATLPLARPILSIGGYRGQVGDVFLVGMYLALVVGWLRRGARPRGTVLLVAGLAYLAALGLSLVVSGGEPRAWLKLAGYATLVLLPWAAANVLTSREALAWTVRAWIAGLLVAVAVGVVQLLAFYLARRFTTEYLMCSYGRLPSGPYPRLCAPFNNPNMFQNYLAASAPLLVGFGALVLPARRWLIAAGAAAAIVVAFALSTGIGGTALAVGLFVWLRGRRDPSRAPRARLALAAGALVAIGFAAVTVGHTVPEGRGQIPLGSREWHLVKGPRVATWLSAAATVRDHPLTGVGYGDVVAEKPRLRRWLRQDVLEPFRGPVRRNLEAHEVWLNVAGQAGLVGLAAFVLLLVVLTRGLLRARVPTPLGDLPAAVAAGLVGALAFHGLFAAIEEARHVWGLLALAAAPRAERGGVAPGPGTGA